MKKEWKVPHVVDLGVRNTEAFHCDTEEGPIEGGYHIHVRYCSSCGDGGYAFNVPADFGKEIKCTNCSALRVWDIVQH